MTDAPTRRPRGIRTRITTLAAVIVATALILGALAFWFVLRTSLHTQLQTAAQQDAAAFADQLDESGGAIEVLPDVDDDRFWQVLDPDAGRVLRASDVAEEAAALANADGVAPMLVVFDDGAVFEVAAVREGDLVVVAGRATEPVEETLATVTVLLAVSVPIVIAVVAVVAWLAVGRSLAPVERMRRQVEAVSAADLAQRVDDPGSGDELSRLARTMNAMLARLAASQSAQRRFVSDASHELKSPLASLRQFAEVAAAYPDRVSRDELVEAVLDEGGRLEALVRGMLVLTRADEGALALHRGEVDLAAVVRAEGERVTATSALRVETDAGTGVILSADRALIGQVVRNLVDNAVRHAGTRIRLAVAYRPPGVVLVVEDDGHGIPPAERDRVFERFVRLDEARARDSGGSGLGLAIVREIVVAHGGSVSADASPLGGARLVVRLPRCAGGASGWLQGRRGRVVRNLRRTPCARPSC